MEDGSGLRPLPEEELRRLAAGMQQIVRDLHLLVHDPTGGELVRRLGQHLGSDPRQLPVVTHEFPMAQLVDIDAALAAWTEEADDRRKELLGITGPHRRGTPLSELLTGDLGVGVGPVDYVDCADSPDTTRSCVRIGLFLLSDRGRPLALLLRGSDRQNPSPSGQLELIAADPDHGRAFLSEVIRISVERSVLRGQVLAFGGSRNGYGGLRFIRRPVMARSELVLPEATLDQIERHVLGIAELRSRLREAGQHLKRGVLLYGPPGTGKTHTVRYLLAQMPGVTTFILSGEAYRNISYVCGLARSLQPAVVILEDVDLVAADRSFGPPGGNPLLFEVLNHIDGLGDDVDVTFLLTTNRVDILERALAERPGRVDAAVPIEAPDPEGRVRLFRLYGGAVGLGQLGEADLEPAVAATEGCTATYLREVVRRAALIAAEGQPTGPLRVDGPALARAATELLDDRAALTRAILGGLAREGGRPAPPVPPSHRKPGPELPPPPGDW
ncbi:MAG TPA: ATP-binding protein [Candidatus Dormibacteraeota bacterium]|nr:ATP-binding protein [Candidatus Dormibacteraeota bacterium]